jgi:anti-sigma factor RsiW
MTNDEANRLLNAYIDGELDPAKTLELEAQLAGNPSLRAACGRLREPSVSRPTTTPPRPGWRSGCAPLSRTMRRPVRPGRPGGGG